VAKPAGSRKEHAPAGIQGETESEDVLIDELAALALGLDDLECPPVMPFRNGAGSPK
jgi:hypothetical protein